MQEFIRKSYSERKNKRGGAANQAKNKMTHPNIARRTAKNYRDSVLVSLMGADHMYESGKFQQKTLRVIEG